MNKFCFVSFSLIITLCGTTIAHAMSDDEENLIEVISHFSPIPQVTPEAPSQLTIYSPQGLELQEFEIPELAMDEVFKNISVNDLVQSVRLVSQNFKALVHEHLSKREQTKIDDLVKRPPPPPRPLVFDGLFEQGLLAHQILFQDLFVPFEVSLLHIDFYPFNENLHIPSWVAELPDSEKRIVQSAKIHHKLVQDKKRSDYEKRMKRWDELKNFSWEPLKLELLEFEFPKLELMFIRLGEKEYQQLQKWQTNLIKAQSSRGKKHNKQRKVKHAFNMVRELEARIKTLYKPQKHGIVPVSVRDTSRERV